MKNTIVATESALPPMIDTHCHLDDHQFETDLDDVLRTAMRANVNRWILIGYDPDRWDDVIELADSHAGMSHTLGVHPACAPAWNDATEARLRRLLVSSAACGIGEAGLDYYRDNAAPAIQKAAFTGQIDVAVDLGLPLVIHLRSAEPDMLDVLSNVRQLPKLLFHSFDGSERLLDFVINSDSYVGIGGLATRQKSSELRSLLTRVSMERIVLETDSPYLVPAKQKDRRNQPAQIATIASIMANELGLSASMLASQSTANAERLFGLTYDL